MAHLWESDWERVHKRLKAAGIVDWRYTTPSSLHGRLSHSFYHRCADCQQVSKIEFSDEYQDCSHCGRSQRLATYGGICGRCDFTMVRPKKPLSFEGKTYENVNCEPCGECGTLNVTEPYHSPGRPSFGGGASP